MKKYFFLSLFLVAGLLCANAQVAYLLTTAAISDLPLENVGGVDQKPEQNAANWFQTTYVNANKGTFVSISDLKSGLDDNVKVLWINVDRQGLADLAAAGIDADAIAAVKAFVEKGGHVFLTKQANMIAYNMGRIGYAPGWSNGGYSVGGDVWSINAQLGLWPDITEKFDRRNHAIFTNMTVDATSRAYTYNEVVTYYETYPLVGMVARTDNNQYVG